MRSKINLYVFIDIDGLLVPDGIIRPEVNVYDTLSKPYFHSNMLSWIYLLLEIKFLKLCIQGRS